MTDNKKLLQEFKAPIIAIIGMTDVLKQTELSKEQRAFAQNIEDAASSLLRLINEIIDSSAEPQAPLVDGERFTEVGNELRGLVANQSDMKTEEGKSVSDLKVLIVEDNPLLQLVIMKQLAHLGIPADAVSDGRAAVDEADKYDLIFMDCRLPIFDGFQATKMIRENEGRNGRSKKRIIALTAGYEDMIREKCLESGMDDCLIKPVGSQALKQTIERWFQPVKSEPPRGK